MNNKYKLKMLLRWLKNSVERELKNTLGNLRTKNWKQTNKWNRFNKIFKYLRIKPNNKLTKSRKLYKIYKNNYQVQGNNIRTLLTSRLKLSWMSSNGLKSSKMYNIKQSKHKFRQQNSSKSIIIRPSNKPRSFKKTK